MNRKLQRKKTIVTMIALLLSVVFVAAGASADPVQTGAQTAPPPISDSVDRYVPDGGTGTGTGTSSGGISPMGQFNPSHIYLMDGWTSLTNNGLGSIDIAGGTRAYSIVDQVGIQITLQCWSGSYWYDVYTAPSLYNYNNDTVAEYYSRNVPVGYYYRVNGFHSAVKGGVIETGTTFGGYVYLN